MTEEGKIQAITNVAKGVVNGLSHNPTLLALVMLNVIGLGVVFWYLHSLIGRNTEILTLILKACLPK